MNLLNRLGRFVLSISTGALLGGAMFLSGCNLLVDPVQAPEEIDVSLRVDEVFQDKAHVRLNHEGSVED
ncbi:MAG: hypothetical protein J6Q12_07275, partial [Bacteroidales bacterium]|nr:hypothetical protein [Bacteroidales bacterium]